MPSTTEINETETTTVKCDGGDLPAYKEFEAMDLPDNLLRGIFAYGFERPSVIQQRAIVPMRGDRDLIAQSQSGTGKTGAFVIGLLQQIDFSQRRPRLQALILAPTRELAEQSAGVASAVGDYMGVVCHALVGGRSRSEDVNTLRKNPPHIVSGTPGRVWDLAQRGALDVRDLRVLVLDEADEMLNRGFQEQVQTIFQMLPGDIKVCLFSATLTPETMDIAQRFMRDPITITVVPEEVTLEGIAQYYVDVGRSDSNKFDVLCDIYDKISITQSVIFCNTRRTVERLTKAMTEEDHAVSAIHSDLTPDERRAVFKLFKDGTTRVLIATDVMARGIDVQTISTVINFDCPSLANKENYIHRIGRGGRFGRKGVAINFVGDGDWAAMRGIEEFYATNIKPLPEDLTMLMP